MARDLDLLLTDILAGMKAAVRCVKDLDGEAFVRLPETQDLTYRALKNALTEIGEATKLLPIEFRERNPKIGWKGLAGLRDIVAHQYFRLDMVRLWPVVSEEIPAAIPVMEQAISELAAPDEDTPSAGPGR